VTNNDIKVKKFDIISRLLRSRNTCQSLTRESTQNGSVYVQSGT